MIARITHFKIIEGKIDEAIAAMEMHIVSALGNIEGMVTCTVTHDSESGECVTTAVYKDQKTADLAQSSTQQIWASMGPFLAGPPVLRVNEVLLSYSS